MARQNDRRTRAEAEADFKLAEDHINRVQGLIQTLQVEINRVTVERTEAQERISVLDHEWVQSDCTAKRCNGGGCVHCKGD